MFDPQKVFLQTLLAMVIFSPLQAEETQIRFVTWRPGTPWVWERAISDFESRHPGVRVVREVGPSSSTQLHDLVTQKLKNRDPGMDVFFMDVIWPAEFAAAGWVLALDRFFGPEEQEKFLQGPVEASRYRGQTFGVPVFIDAGILYYRKDLLVKYRFSPPRTWPELVRQAQFITDREADSRLVGYSGQFKQYEGLICNMMEFILSNGGSLWDAEGLRSTLHLPRVQEAVRFVRDRVVGEISHRGVLAYEEPESLALFTQGRAIFHRNWPYAWEIANDPRRSKIAGRVGMRPLPSFAQGKSVSALGGWQLGISRFSRHPELAWKFVSFMTSPEVQKRIALWTGRAPTRKALYKDADILRKHPQLGEQLETFIRAVPRPRTPVYIPMSNIMQRFFSSAIALPNSRIQQLSRQASKDVDRILDLLRPAP